LFSSQTEVVATPAGEGSPVTSVLSTDPPLHRSYRNLTLPYFKPRALRSLESRIRELTLELIAGAPDALDFATDFAAWHPLRMLSEVLGVPEPQVVLEMTNGLIGSADPEYAGLPRFGPYLRSLIASRRARPTSDLSSLIANSWLNDRDAVLYLMIIAVA